MKVIATIQLPDMLVKTQCETCGSVFEFQTNEALHRVITKEKNAYFPFISHTQQAHVIECSIACPVCSKIVTVVPDQPIKWSKPVFLGD